MLSSQVACMLFRPSYYIKALVHRQFSTPQNSQLSPRIWSAITLEQKTKIMIIKLLFFFPIEQNNVLTFYLHIHVCVYSKWQSLRKGAFLHL